MDKAKIKQIEKEQLVSIDNVIFEPMPKKPFPRDKHIYEYTNAEFEKVRAETTDLVNRLENEGTNYLTTVTGVLNDAVENFDGTGNAGSFATEDVNNFDTALEFLNKISRASFFVGLAGSRNTHERFLVDNFIGDTNLKNLLEDADKEEDARLTFE